MLRWEICIGHCAPFPSQLYRDHPHPIAWTVPDRITNAYGRMTGRMAGAAGAAHRATSLPFGPGVPTDLIERG